MMIVSTNIHRNIKMRKQSLQNVKQDANSKAVKTPKPAVKTQKQAVKIPKQPQTHRYSVHDVAKGASACFLVIFEWRNHRRC